MKKLNLNIDFKEKIKFAGEEVQCPHCKKSFIIGENEPLSSVEIAQIWMQNIIERTLNEFKVDSQTGELITTKTQVPKVHRKYNKIMDIIESPKDGIIELDDDDFNWIQEKFENPKGGVAIQRSVSRVIAALMVALSKAEISDEQKNI